MKSRNLGSDTSEKKEPPHIGLGKVLLQGRARVCATYRPEIGILDPSRISSRLKEE